jgi:hypothetical protein
MRLVILPNQVPGILYIAPFGGHLHIELTISEFPYIMGSRIEGTAQVVESLIYDIMPGAFSLSAFAGDTFLIWRAEMGLPMMSALIAQSFLTIISGLIIT